MSKIKIVSDSTLDLSNEELNKYGIEITPLSITINGETLIDRIDITPSQFLERMKQCEELPKSSQPAVGQFMDLYNRLAAQGYDIISIHMSGGMSGTVSSAKSAAEMSEANVTVIDSKFITRSLGFQVIEAAKMAKQGKTMNDIIEKIHEVREKTKLYISLDTLENLVKGGRIGRGRALIGSLLNIKPIAILSDGIYTPIAKVRSHSQMIKFLVKQFGEDTEGKQVKGIAIAHAGAYELALKLKSAITSIHHMLEIDIVETTPIITTHTGPGAIGFTYYTD